MRACAYVDGFNLYYRAVRNTPYKWLDLLSVCRREFPAYDIVALRYFTAKISSPQHDAGKGQRQETYLRALRTLPSITIHFGQFHENTVWRPLATPLPDGTTMVQVIDTKEKGSDVNLATSLLLDGFKKLYQVAIVVSNDSDLVEPVRVVRYELGLDVAVLDPHQGRRVSNAFKSVASVYTKLRPETLKACQFPDTLSDQHGSVTKPADW